MDEYQGREILIYVLLNGQPIPPDKIDNKIENDLHNIGIDVYQQLTSIECSTHLGRKTISVYSDDGEISVHIFTCCHSFATTINQRFKHYPYKMLVSYPGSI